MVTRIMDDNAMELSWFQEKLRIAADENPDLPLDFICDILLSIEEVKHGFVELYEFGSGNINNND